MPRQGHNTPPPLKRSPPASFKRLLGSTAIGAFFVIVGRADGPLVERHHNPVDERLLELLSTAIARRKGFQLNDVGYVEVTDIPTGLLDECSCNSLRSARNRLVHKGRGECAVDFPVVRVRRLRMRFEREEVHSNDRGRRNIECCLTDRA